MFFLTFYVLSDELCSNNFHKLTWFIHNWRTINDVQYSTLEELFKADDDSNGSIWVQFCVHLHFFFEKRLKLKNPPDVTEPPMNYFRVPDEYFYDKIPGKVDHCLKKYKVMKIDDDLKFAIPIKIPCE